MKKAWEWLRVRAWPWLVSAALALIGAGWLWRRRAVQRETEIRQRVELDTIRERVEMLRTQRKRLQDANLADDVAIKYIDLALEENRQELERAHNVGDLTDDEVLAEFKRLGF